MYWSAGILHSLTCTVLPFSYPRPLVLSQTCRYYTEPSKGVPTIAGGKDRYETKQYSPSLIALAAGAGLSAMRAIERAKSFTDIAALNTQLHSLGSCGFSMDDKGRVDNGTASPCATDGQCAAVVPGETCKFVNTFIGPLFYADGSTKDKLLGTNTRNAMTLAQIHNNSLTAIGPRASRACNLNGPGTCDVLSFMGNICTCKREYPTFWAWSPKVMDAPQVTWARMPNTVITRSANSTSGGDGDDADVAVSSANGGASAFNNTRLSDSEHNRQLAGEWVVSSTSKVGCGVKVVTVFQPKYIIGGDPGAISTDADEGGCPTAATAATATTATTATTNPGAPAADTKADAEEEASKKWYDNRYNSSKVAVAGTNSMVLPLGPQFRVTARASIVEGTCLASKGVYFQAHLIHSDQDNVNKYGQGVDVEKYFFYKLKDTAKSSLGVNVPVQWKNIKGVLDVSAAATATVATAAATANATGTKKKTMVVTAQFDIAFETSKQLSKSATAYSTMIPTQSGEYDLRVVVTCGPEPVSNLISLGQSASSGDNLLCGRGTGKGRGCIRFSVGCPPGSVRLPGENTGACTMCTQGTYYKRVSYNNRIFRTCENCRKDEQSSPDLLSCICKVGSYRDPHDDTCKVCHVGLNCSTPGSTLANVWVMPGYWRDNNNVNGTFNERSINESSPHKCPCNESCTGGPPGTYCAAGEYGMMCSECKKGYHRYRSRSPCQKVRTGVRGGEAGVGVYHGTTIYDSYPIHILFTSSVPTCVHCNGEWPVLLIPHSVIQWLTRLIFTLYSST